MNANVVVLFVGASQVPNVSLALPATLPHCNSDSDYVRHADSWAWQALSNAT